MSTRIPSRRAAAWLVSATLVFGFSLFPIFAEADSAGVQYHDSLPTASGNDKKPSGEQNKQKSSDDQGSSNSSGSGNGGSGGSSGGSGSGGSGSGGSGSAATPAGSAQSSGSTGSGAANGSAAQSSSQANDGGQKSGADTLKLGTPANYQAHPDDGGSSPLAPILIGLGLLVAIAACVAVFRARRQREQADAYDSRYAS